MTETPIRTEGRPLGNPYGWEVEPGVWAVIYTAAPLTPEDEEWTNTEEDSDASNA